MMKCVRLAENMIRDAFHCEDEAHIYEPLPDGVGFEFLRSDCGPGGMTNIRYHAKGIVVRSPTGLARKFDQSTGGRSAT
jgi:hypothetical protein